MQTTSQQTFSEWRRELNKLVIGRLGMGLSDLPDMCIRDWFDDELTTYQALEEVVESVEDDFGMDLDF